MPNAKKEKKKEKPIMTGCHAKALPVTLQT
jgi:hypothetical protein